MDSNILRTPEEKTEAFMNIIKGDQKMFQDFLELKRRNPEHFEKVMEFILTPAPKP